MLHATSTVAKSKTENSICFGFPKLTVDNVWVFRFLHPWRTATMCEGRSWGCKSADDACFLGISLETHFKKGNYAKNSIRSNGCTWNCCNYVVLVRHALLPNARHPHTEKLGCHSNLPAEFLHNEEGWSSLSKSMEIREGEVERHTRVPKKWKK